jgi:hypothetical protein
MRIARIKHDLACGCGLNERAAATEIHPGTRLEFVLGDGANMRFTVALCLALFVLPTSLPARETAKPAHTSVVLFLVDDMGWMDGGAYGSK